jgi:hypothetical protein
MRKVFILFLSMITFAVAGAQSSNSPDSLKEYTGKFKFPDGSPFSEVSVLLENGVLMASSSAGSSELKRREGDVFDIVSYSGTAIFKRDDAKKVVRMQVQVQDVDAEGERVDGSPAPQHPWKYKLRSQFEY